MLFRSGREKYYLATMEVYGAEGRQKVERHRKLREGKGFETLEYPLQIRGAAEQVTGGTVLLECLSNLLANEMFSKSQTEFQQPEFPQPELPQPELPQPEFSQPELDRPENAEREYQVVERILGDIQCVAERAEHLVIVTNNVFEDGILYPQETMEYIENLGRLNQRLTEIADVVTEVVVSIPVPVKGEAV